MTKKEIELNYKKAVQQAEQLERIASGLKRMANEKFEHSMGAISSNWKGENATGFAQKGNTLKNKTLLSANEVEAIAKEIRNAASKIRKVDLLSIEVANGLH